jgi:hypothetical protein
MMIFQHQAVGRDTCAQIRALTREGGEQGCAASLDACKPGVTAHGLFVILKKASGRPID